MIETFRLITIHGTGDARELSKGISEALVHLELSLPIAILGVILSGIALWGMKLREPWFFWGLMIYSFIWPFLGGIWGIGLIIYLIVKRKDFFKNERDFEPGVAHNGG